MMGIEAGYAYRYHHGMWTELITLDMFFYHQSNAGLIMHSMQEFKQTGQWLDIGLSRIIMIMLVITMIMIIMDIHIGSNTHTQPQTCHLSQGPARAPVSSERNRRPGTVPEYKQSHNDHRECAYQFINTLLSGLVSKYWDKFSTFSTRIQYHLSDIPYTIYAVMI